MSGLLFNETINKLKNGGRYATIFYELYYNLALVRIYMLFLCEGQKHEKPLFGFRCRLRRQLLGSHYICCHPKEGCKKGAIKPLITYSKGLINDQAFFHGKIAFQAPYCYDLDINLCHIGSKKSSFLAGISAFCT
jgi:hypothetical protein